MENSETIVWLDFARACEFISESEHHEFITRFEEVGRMLHHAINNPQKFL
jgi:four helix bundle protein